MLVRLKKISDKLHLLELVRDDGTRESVELVSRSFLWHDLLHYSVETNAELHRSFWGLLASGNSLTDLHDATRGSNSGGTKASPAEAARTEAMVTEAIVGVLTNVVRGRAAPSGGVDGLARLFEAQDREVPSWFTADFVERVHEHMRKLMGQWSALPYGDEMQLTFP